MDLVDASPDRRTIALSAHAKINLALRVGPPAHEGAMHPIASWMARIDLADHVHVTRLEHDRLSRYAILWHDEAPMASDIDWPITSDLAVRAHLLLEEHVGRNLPVQLKLEKRIPVGAGLGGGSADGAAMLRAVDALFDLALGDDELCALAQQLGSDVAFCLGRTPALVHGLGEMIEPAPGVDAWLTLIIPGFPCATGAVYGAFDEMHAGWPGEPDAVRDLAMDAAPDDEALFNDLAEPAASVEPRLGALRIAAADCALRPVHVTGSGSALFALCGSRDEAVALGADIERSCEGPWGRFVCVPARIV